MADHTPDRCPTGLSSCPLDDAKLPTHRVARSGSGLHVGWLAPEVAQALDAYLLALS
jgi:hypothetical protein